MVLVLVVVSIVLALILGSFIWRLADARMDRRVWHELAESAKSSPDVFDKAQIEQLPEPARRYFQYTIQPGASLYTVAELEMGGELGLGNKENPKFTSMRARQILAPPHGLVWRLKASAVSGSDGATSYTSWTRFWLFGFVPLVRAGEDADHQRSAFGRVVAEGMFWTPAAFLPGKYVRWDKVDTDTARALVRFGGFEQAVDITVAANGQPTQVAIQRWSNANVEKKYRLQSFGGYLSDFREFTGYRLPTRVEGGNLFGTEDYFPFFKANVTSVKFISSSVST